MSAPFLMMPFAIISCTRCQDHALPAGTCTELSLARVLGCESEVSIPVGCSIRCQRREDDHCSRDASEGVSGSSGSTRSSSSGKVESRLVLKLRQVNGDGVLSGVSIGWYVHAAVVNCVQLLCVPGTYIRTHLLSNTMVPLGTRYRYIIPGTVYKGASPRPVCGFAHAHNGRGFIAKSRP